MHDAAKALREIQKSVKKWSDIHGRLKVWVRDEDRHRLDESIDPVRAFYRLARRVLDRVRPASGP
jgi:hypothetical protein